MGLQRAAKGGRTGETRGENLKLRLKRQGQWRERSDDERAHNDLVFYDQIIESFLEKDLGRRGLKMDSGEGSCSWRPCGERITESALREG